MAGAELLRRGRGGRCICRDKSQCLKGMWQYYYYKRAVNLEMLLKTEFDCILSLYPLFSPIFSKNSKFSSHIVRIIPPHSL